MKEEVIHLACVDSKQLHYNFQKIRQNIDKVPTANLSKIKEVIKRVHFADIMTKQQILDNQGDAFYKIYENEEGRTFHNLTLSYTITPEKTGLVYGTFKESKDKEGNIIVSFKGADFSNYARFLADVSSGKVIYSKEFERFLIVLKQSYRVLDEITFNLEYPVHEKKYKISDFLNVIEQIFQTCIQIETHNYRIYPTCFSGLDWFYDCERLELVPHIPQKNELYQAFYEVEHKALNLMIPKQFIEMVASDAESLHNVNLLHAYSLLAKIKIVPLENLFILKDFGRTGKGLLLKTFQEVFSVNQVNMDNLMNGGFEANNEWVKFYGCDIAHANETGEINRKSMRILRKIATGEVVTGREIGKDNVKFKIEAVLILDTNETVDVGSITANKSRTVKIAFKDRPKSETKETRFSFFKPYWDFIAPNGIDTRIEASLSFLLHSLNYLSLNGGKFNFKEATLKNYASADELTETQRILLTVIGEDGFISCSDPILQNAIQEDYGNLRFSKAKEDIAKIGVHLNQQKWINGANIKVNIIGDSGLFKASYTLLKDVEN